MGRLRALIPLLILALGAGGAFYLLTRTGERPAHFADGVGRVAPAYDLTRLGGGENVRPAEFAGRAYLINLFASWCTPCRAEHPLLMELEAQGATILGVAYRDQPAAAQGFLDELGDPFAVRALDPDGRFSLDLGFQGVPETYVIGANGRILAVHRGPLTRDVLAETIRPALSGRAQLN